MGIWFLDEWMYVISDNIGIIYNMIQLFTFIDLHILGVLCQQYQLDGVLKEKQQRKVNFSVTKNI